MTTNNFMSREGQVKGITKSINSHGREFIEFKDDYGNLCSIQESGSGVPHIWFGRNENEPPHHVTGKSLSPRMHLSQDQVKELLPFLKNFAETGEIGAVKINKKKK